MVLKQPYFIIRFKSIKNETNSRLIVSESLNKGLRKPNGQSRMDNPETLATLGTRDTGPLCHIFREM